MLGLSGDALAAFGILMSWALTAGGTALTVSGRVRVALWILAAIFSTLAAGVYFADARITSAVALPLIYALTPPLTVGTVAVMLRGLRAEIRASKGGPQEPDAAKARIPRLFVNIHATLTPNMSLAQLAAHVEKRTHLTGDELLHEIRDKLALAKLCAWAAETEDSALNEVADWAWRDARLDLRGSSATISGGKRLHRIKVDKAMAEYVWSARRGPTGY